MKIAYEKHPVSKERKEELRSKGFKIIDARFDPDRKDREVSPEKIVEMERDDVIALLKKNGVDDPKGKIADLRNRLTAILFPEV